LLFVAILITRSVKSGKHTCVIVMYEVHVVVTVSVNLEVTVLVSVFHNISFVHVELPYPPLVEVLEGVDTPYPPLVDCLEGVETP
jgi:hypothetical protein